MYEPTTILLAAIGVLFIGVAKAGMGGGLGMLTTPICVLAFRSTGLDPKYVIGTLLPLLIVGDTFSIYHYWGKWEKRHLWLLLPGVVAGVLIGVQLIDKFSPRQLNLIIGILAVSFVVFQYLKEMIVRAEGNLQPGYRVGVPFGVVAGITSTFAHGAGPVVTMYLLPQRLPKVQFVGTNVLIFTWINWIKMPFFIGQGIITRQTLLLGLAYVGLVPLGVWAGLWLNRRVSETWFIRVVYAVTFLAGLQLILDVNIATWISGE